MCLTGILFFLFQSALHTKLLQAFKFSAPHPSHLPPTHRHKWENFVEKKYIYFVKGTRLSFKKSVYIIAIFKSHFSRSGMENISLFLFLTHTETHTYLVTTENHFHYILESNLHYFCIFIMENKTNSIV